MQYFTIFQDKLHSFNIQNRTKHAWAFSKTVQKNSKITYTASRLSLLTSAKFSVNINIIKNLLCLFFLLNGFKTMSNLKKRLIPAELKTCRLHAKISLLLFVDIKAFASCNKKL